jgi:hypothetical protein
VQRRAHDRRAGQALRSLDRVAVGLLDGSNGRLHRRVPDLHHAALGVVAGVAALDRHHEMDPARAEPEGHRRGVQHDRVADGDRTHEVGVGDGGALDAVDGHRELVHAGARLAQRRHDATAEADHLVGPGSANMARL